MSGWKRRAWRSSRRHGGCFGTDRASQAPPRRSSGAAAARSSARPFSTAAAANGGRPGPHRWAVGHNSARTYSPSTARPPRNSARRHRRGVTRRCTGGERGRISCSAICTRVEHEPATSTPSVFAERAPRSAESGSMGGSRRGRIARCKRVGCLGSLAAAPSRRRPPCFATRPRRVREAVSTRRQWHHFAPAASPSAAVAWELRKTHGRRRGGDRRCARSRCLKRRSTWSGSCHARNMPSAGLKPGMCHRCGREVGQVLNTDAEGRLVPRRLVRAETGRHPSGDFAPSRACVVAL